MPRPIHGNRVKYRKKSKKYSPTIRSNFNHLTKPVTARFHLIVTSLSKILIINIPYYEYVALCQNHFL